MDRNITTSQTQPPAPGDVRRPQGMPLHPAMGNDPLEVWHLKRVGCVRSVTRAVHLTGAEHAAAGIPSCGFATPVFRTVGRETVVDAAVFTDLRTVRTRHAATFDPAGEAIGRLVVMGHEPRDVVKLLVHAGVIDSGSHAETTVAVMAEGHDDEGYWFRLLAEDQSRADHEHCNLYAFGVRVSPIGMMFVTNPHFLPGG